MDTPRPKPADSPPGQVEQDPSAYSEAKNVISSFVEEIKVLEEAGYITNPSFILHGSAANALTSPNDLDVIVVAERLGYDLDVLTGDKPINQVFPDSPNLQQMAMKITGVAASPSTPDNCFGVLPTSSRLFPELNYVIIDWDTLVRLAGGYKDEWEHDKDIPGFYKKPPKEEFEAGYAAAHFLPLARKEGVSKEAQTLINEWLTFSFVSHYNQHNTDALSLFERLSLYERSQPLQKLVKTAEQNKVDKVTMDSSRLRELRVMLAEAIMEEIPDKYHKFVRQTLLAQKLGLTFIEATLQSGAVLIKGQNIKDHHGRKLIALEDLDFLKNGTPQEQGRLRLTQC